MKSYIRGKYARAACDLMDELKLAGISASTVGYDTRNGSGAGKTLLVGLSKPADAQRLPAEFRGFKVRALPSEGRS